MAEPLLRYQSVEPTSITSLSTEIVTHILEALYDLDPRAINTARRICRTFNHLATPLAYETVHINQQITSLEAVTLFPHALRNIHAHTRHVVLRSGLDRHCVSILLNKLQKLRSVRYICLPLLSETPGLTAPDLRWSFICNTGPRYNRWVPSDINSLTAHEPAKIKIHIEGLPLGALDGKHADLYRSVIPSQSLVSLETTVQHPTAVCAAEPHLPSLKELLLASKSLEVFRYRDNEKTPTRFYFDQGERLPAFKELTLRSYDWTHGVEEAALHWDFSKIRSLELVSVSAFNFFSSVSCRLGDFANLHTLRVDDSGIIQHHHRSNGDESREQSQEAAAASIIHSLIRDHIHALHSLHLTVDIASFPIDALLRHSGTLKRLIFRHHHQAFSTTTTADHLLLSVTSLGRLARSMTRLESLEIDINVFHPSLGKFQGQMWKLKRLRNLTLITCIKTVAGHAQFPDGDDEICAEERILDILRRSRGRRMRSRKTGPLLPVATWETVVVINEVGGGGGGGGWQQQQ
ncbi:hypothetical protein QBC37DRAFT_114833 [Rhypophila decipiens]|uniref:F-box domain-containing protein n=1 Tax=Rhypophila decipiens TaxID=261697 RepID=A0AAN6YC19_9PEZI|nr:hypothetical protein QBC37DRAFT_114833 [Rhypophila decipiens]